jgi:hypothetical protein
MTTHLPNLRAEPVQIEVVLNKVKVAAFSLFRPGWLTIETTIPEEARSFSDSYQLELTASRTWQPRVDVENREQRDDREISIAVCNIEVFDL